MNPYRLTCSLAVALSVLTGCGAETRPSEADNASVVFSTPDESKMTWGDILMSEITPRWSDPKHRAFDFWIGEWEMEWRGRAEDAFHYDEAGEWTRQRVFPVLGGKALIETAWAREGFDEASRRGFSLRYFDDRKQRWVMLQNWMGPNGTGSAFADQLIGDYSHGRHSLYSIVRRPTEDGDLEILHRRYTFSDIDPGQSFRWDGASTRDFGKTWNTWNIVDAHYLRPLDPYALADQPLPGVHSEALCTTGPHGKFDWLEGHWRGTAPGSDGSERPLTFHVGKVVDGCGLLGIIRTPEKSTLFTLGYIGNFERWVLMTLDDQPGTTHAYSVAGDDEDISAIRFRSSPGLRIEDEFTPYIGSEAFSPPEDTQPTTSLSRTSDTSFEIRMPGPDGSSILMQLVRIP